MLAYLLSFSAASALEVPHLSGRVNDYAGMISPGTEAELEARLADLEKNESTQVVILTVLSLQGKPIEDFSIKVAEAWKTGWKGVDNGVLFVVSREDRKMRIEVGYGLEGRLTDLVAGRIVDNEVSPLFKAGRFDEGFRRGVESILLAVHGEYKEKPRAEENGSPSLFLVLLIVLFIYFLSQTTRGSGGGGPIIYGGGPGGGSSGGGFDGGFSGGGGGFGGGGASGDW
ncbi:MAG: TPM domain-containing protein [Chlorobi bacterium]|nr:TPM domain-containing protein [Chlorobiota bacterium]